MSRVAVVTINLAAIRHNLSVAIDAAKRSSQQSKILAVIKANAYGHGLIPVAESLVEADAFAVAHFEEAIILRKNFPRKDIVVLQGFADEIELALLLSQSIQPVIHSVFQITILEKFLEKNPIEDIFVWLKFDTGMHRLGVSTEAFHACWERLNNITDLKGNVRLMSHFANADVPAHPDNKQQEKIFNDLTSSLDCDKSFSNSAALLFSEKNHHQWIRPGLMLYGVSPFEGQKAAHHGLLPAMNLSSRIIAINEVKKGQAIGYGSCWKAKVDTKIAVVGIGYGDGYPRHIEDNTPVLIHGKRFLIVGRVSMDMIFVDIGNEVSGQLNGDIGDEVLLWGEGLPIEEISNKASTIAYELLCQVTARVKYIYQDEQLELNKQSSSKLN